MIEVQVWILWGLLTVPFGVGAGITAWATRFALKRDCEMHRHNFHKEIDSRFDQELNHRKEIWNKIDQMHEWMITGVIKINRG
jgi:hypothetical protein